METVRKQEVREGQVPELKGSKFLWRYSKENLPESQRKCFEALRAMNLKVGWAWAVKEELRPLWHALSMEET